MAWTAGLVFKGGTALRLTRFRDFRYSADLDFSLVDMEETEALDSFDAALPKVAARIAFPVLQLERGPRAEIAYVGPLARLRTIKLDLASDEVVVEVEPALILTRYDDQVARASIRCAVEDEIGRYQHEVPHFGALMRGLRREVRALRG
jgi:hypothetical protein